MFGDPSLPGERRVTLTVTKVCVGTDQGIERAGQASVIPLDTRHLGWPQSLARLAPLVEPEAA